MFEMYAIDRTTLIIEYTALLKTDRDDCVTSYAHAFENEFRSVGHDRGTRNLTRVNMRSVENETSNTSTSTYKCSVVAFL